jgi:arsenate reductase-like glutaredoxin family protein
MSGFENLPQAIDEGLAQRPMTPDEAKFAEEKYADEVALGLVLKDTARAESFVTAKGLQAEWNRMDNVLRAVVKSENWHGTTIPRAHLSMPLAMEVIEALQPQIHMAFFSDVQPFLMMPKGKTKPAAARAIAKVVNWAQIEAGFKEEVRKMIKSDLHLGQCVGKWGWETSTKIRKEYRRDGKDVKAYELESKISRPTFEYVDLKNVLVDPGTRSQDIRSAGYVIYQKFVDANELDALRESGYDKIPSRAQLKEILANLGEPTQDSLSAVKTETWRENSAEKQDLATSSDPLAQPLELLEYWTPDRVITVLQRKIVIRNEANEFGELPFVSCAFIDVRNAFYGFGVTKLVEGDQVLQAGVINGYIDQLNLYMQPPMKRAANTTGPINQTELTAPGKVLNNGLEPVQLQPPSIEALNTVAFADTRAHRRVGANSGSEMPTQALRTAEGVQAFTSGVQNRLQYFVEQFADLVFIPSLKKMVELCKDRLTPEQIDAILTEEEGKAYQDWADGGDITEVYNASCSVEPLTSTKLAARRAMVQMIIPTMQLLAAEPTQNSLTQQGLKSDFAEFMRLVYDLAGMDASTFIVPMTPEDQQRAMAMNPAILKAQADKEMQVQKQQNALELVDAQGMAKAGVKVIDHTLKMSEPKEPAKPLPNQKKPGSK